MTSKRTRVRIVYTDPATSETRLYGTVQSRPSVDEQLDIARDFISRSYSISGEAIAARAAASVRLDTQSGAVV